MRLALTSASGLFGVHLAYDNEQLKGGGNVAVFGVGAHVAP